MKTIRIFVTALLLSALGVQADVVSIDENAFGKSLGGWRKADKQVAEYPLSGAMYRTYKPEVTPTPNGGIFVSVRIDHVRGWFSTNDYAVLEITINSDGVIAAAQSSVAIQGTSVASDVIRSTTTAGQEIAGANRAVQIGTDLIADLTSKMLQQKIVEAGRVSFPAVLRHNYNLLFQAIRTAPSAIIASEVDGDHAGAAAAPGPKPAPQDKEPPPNHAATLEVKTYNSGEKPVLSPTEKK